MKTGVPFSPALIVRAQGARLYDHEQILDFTSGQMSSLLGNSYPEIVQVIRKYAAEFDHLLSNIICPPVIDLAERLHEGDEKAAGDRTVYASAFGAPADSDSRANGGASESPGHGGAPVRGTMA